MTTMRSPLLLPALALLLAAPARGRAGESIVLFPALGRPTQVAIAGRVLAAAPESHPDASALERNARRLAARGREGVLDEVAFAGEVRRVRAGDDGAFEAAFAAPAGRPFPAGWLPVRAVSGRVTGDGRVQVVEDDAPFLLVTDLDDTIAVTHVRSRRATLEAALLRDAGTHPVVPGMAGLYRCLLGRAPSPGGVVVSGSPLELAARVEGFLAANGFPPLALRLRDLGPRTLSGYKEPALRDLLSHFPHPVVLFGDSGERDPEIYAALRADFPGRVSAIFIRDAGGDTSPVRFAGMTRFAEPAEAARQAAALGLADAGCVAREFPPPSPAAPPP